MCAADRSLIAWVINKFAVTDVEAVGIAASVIPADAARIMCDVAAAAVASGVKSAMVIAVIIVHTTGVVHKVIIGAAVVLLRPRTA